MIETAAKAEGVADVASIQSFIDELVQAYGQVKLCNDLTMSQDERFSMFM